MLTNLAASKGTAGISTHCTGWWRKTKGQEEAQRPTDGRENRKTVIDFK